jgi:GT2 family glycosyltransferase
MLNTRSDYLVILVATYNRLHLLKRTLDSIAAGTRCSHEIMVIDGGSTDGTIEYLKSHPGITPVFQGKLLGTSRCYNQVWKQVESKYTVWLSDDTEVVEGSLDLAVSILETHPEIGMVGLKMKDTMGQWRTRPYMGFLSKYGILNCNHGVLPTDLLRSVGYFNENYRAYTIDPDLTASILCTGKRVVMTKCISVLHHREWANEGTWKDKIKQDMGGIDNKRIYYEKFKFLKQSYKTLLRLRITAWLGHHLGGILFPGSKPDSVRFGLNCLDWHNLINGRFIWLIDPLVNIRRPYYLVQRIPHSLLELETNPYRHLLG